jgi:hypothetical protein
MEPLRASSLVLIPALLLALVAPPADGQDKTFATRGDVEIAGSISYASLTPVSNGKSSDATSIFSFGPQIAYFVADGFEIGFNPGIMLLPGISVLTPPRGDNTTILQLFFYPGYNLRLDGSKTIPFLEVPLGYTSMSFGSATESGFSWGVKAGVKIVVTGRVLLTLYGEYIAVTLNPSNPSPFSTSSERNGFNYLSFGIGVGGFF